MVLRKPLTVQPPRFVARLRRRRPALARWDADRGGQCQDENRSCQHPQNCLENVLQHDLSLL
jgi:hypothetical protein